MEIDCKYPEMGLEMVYIGNGSKYGLEMMEIHLEMGLEIVLEMGLEIGLEMGLQMSMEINLKMGL